MVRPCCAPGCDSLGTGPSPEALGFAPGMDRRKSKLMRPRAEKLLELAICARKLRPEAEAGEPGASWALNEGACSTSAGAKPRRKDGICISGSSKRPDGCDSGSCRAGEGQQAVGGGASLASRADRRLAGRMRNMCPHSARPAPLPRRTVRGLPAPDADATADGRGDDSDEGRRGDSRLASMLRGPALPGPPRSSALSVGTRKPRPGARDSSSPPDDMAGWRTRDNDERAAVNAALGATERQTRGIP